MTIRGEELMRDILTAREGAVLECILAGATNQKIASTLQCSIKTVEFHITNILRKSGEKSRVGLILKCLQQDDNPSS
jgi:DNA-binding NarL/FixJ family response regulator